MFRIVRSLALTAPLCGPEPTALVELLRFVSAKYFLALIAIRVHINIAHHQRVSLDTELCGFHGGAFLYLMCGMFHIFLQQRDINEAVRRLICRMIVSATFELRLAS